MFQIALYDCPVPVIIFHSTNLDVFGLFYQQWLNVCFQIADENVTSPDNLLFLVTHTLHFALKQTITLLEQWSWKFTLVIAFVYWNQVSLVFLQDTASTDLKAVKNKIQRRKNPRG